MVVELCFVKADAIWKGNLVPFPSLHAHALHCDNSLQKWRCPCPPIIHTTPASVSTNTAFIFSAHWNHEVRGSKIKEFSLFFKSQAQQQHLGTVRNQWSILVELRTRSLKWKRIFKRQPQQLQVLFKESWELWMDTRDCDSHSATPLCFLIKI